MSNWIQSILNIFGKKQKKKQTETTVNQINSQISNNDSESIFKPQKTNLQNDVLVDDYKRTKPAFELRISNNKINLLIQYSGFDTVVVYRRILGEAKWEKLSITKEKVYIDPNCYQKSDIIEYKLKAIINNTEAGKFSNISLISYSTTYN